MGNVLEFQSARLQLHLAMLRQMGVPDTLTWRVIGWPRDRFWDADLYARPALVARRRDGSVRIVELVAGSAPAELDEWRLLTASLDALVVREHLARRGDSAKTSATFVFADRGQFHVELPDASWPLLRSAAQRSARDHRRTRVWTGDVARLLQADGLAAKAIRYIRTDSPSRPSRS